MDSATTPLLPAFANLICQPVSAGYLPLRRSPAKDSTMDTLSPYFTTSCGALFAEDCLQFMRRLRDDSVDCIFADPPFNLGKDYKSGFNDRRSRQDYLDWCWKWLGECCRIVKPGGAVFIYALPELSVRFGSFLNAHLDFRHWIAISMKATFARGRRLYPAHYGLLYYTKGEPRAFNRVRLPIPVCRKCGADVKDYGGHRDKLNPEGLNLSDFWDDTSPNRHAKFKVRQGVNELKLMIPERAILISTEPGDVVYDPFGGGGSTYQAAELNGRCWIGTELYDYVHVCTRMKDRFPLSFNRPPPISMRELFREDNDYPVLWRGASEDRASGLGQPVPGAAGYPAVHGGLA